MFSSIRYRVFSEGIAINSSISAGSEVQNSSISWDSRRNWLKCFMYDILIILNLRMVIIEIKIILWSWKKLDALLKGSCCFVNKFLIILALLFCI